MSMPQAWRLAARTAAMRPSAVRDILKVTQQSRVLSLAGGLPSPDSFPIEALAEASRRLWLERGASALQYAASEGWPALRQWVAQRLSAHGVPVAPEQVLITSGSQQGLDLLGKVLIEPGQPVLVEQPSYLGALQSFAPYQPAWHTWATDAEGPIPDGLRAGHRLAYLVPSYQNPSARCVSSQRRRALALRAAAVGVPVVEDDPYGELWYEQAPPPPLFTHAPDDVVLLGSWSKVLAPGLRLGHLVCPASRLDDVGARLLQARQGADLHSSSLGQALVCSLLEQGFDLDAHLAGVRQRYRAQRDALHQALLRHLPPGWQWQVPAGGMFFWLQGPATLDAAALLPQAVNAGVAFVPGEAFGVPGQVASALRSCMRLSFVTLSPDQLDEAVRRLASCLPGAA